MLVTVASGGRSTKRCRGPASDPLPAGSARPWTGDGSIVGRQYRFVESDGGLDTGSSSGADYSVKSFGNSLGSHIRTRRLDRVSRDARPHASKDGWATTIQTYDRCPRDERFGDHETGFFMQ